EDGDDASAIRINGNTAVISTADFFTPMLNDPYDWGRVAAPTLFLMFMRWVVTRLLLSTSSVGPSICSGWMCCVKCFAAAWMSAMRQAYLSLVGIRLPHQNPSTGCQ